MNTKKKPAKNPRPKKRTAGVEVAHKIVVEGWMPKIEFDRLSTHGSARLWTQRFSVGDLKVSMTVHIPKRRSSK